MKLRGIYLERAAFTWEYCSLEAWAPIGEKETFMLWFTLVPCFDKTRHGLPADFQPNLEASCVCRTCSQREASELPGFAWTTLFITLRINNIQSIVCGRWFDSHRSKTLRWSCSGSLSYSSRHHHVDEGAREAAWCMIKEVPIICDTKWLAGNDKCVWPRLNTSGSDRAAAGGIERLRVRMRPPFSLCLEGGWWACYRLWRVKVKVCTYVPPIANILSWVDLPPTVLLTLTSYQTLKGARSWSA